MGEEREKAWKALLEQMEMTPLASEQYLKYKSAVETETRELRVTLDGLEAKSNERVWMKNQVVCDIDDNRLIDGITGERAIYKKRGEQPPELGAPLQLPKRMDFLFDLSASMSRYSHDGRLERSLESA